ncbi:MAG: 4Fe-4S binding protein [Candidatus Aenigmarchaeota archaeon]|nr:4Fe-4S binding protein [Candidatus Aenigmarchaeota archaeon]OYT56738.1 MAG: ferredoxin [Candidatus Aenigmarchaeota archaeon ex4484_14]RLI97571.1 MAG: ferredoxin [Candidatus Aenigmarchaeota archaeon]
MQLIIDKNKCLSCGGCVSVCPKQALELKKHPEWDKNSCIGCELCVRLCPVGALKLEK